jgi:sugar (pentulose or hexulose) kinase
VGVVIGLDVGSHSVRAVALDRDGAVVCRSQAGYVGHPSWPAGEAQPRVWLDAVELAIERLKDAGAETAAALAVGGQSPTAITRTGKGARTYQFAAGVDGGLLAQQEAQYLELCERYGAVEVFQLWDWILLELGAPRVQGRWPADVAFGAFGDRVDTGTTIGEADGSRSVPAGTPLVSGAPDALLSFWAAGLDEPGRGCDPGGRTGGLVVAAEDRVLPSGLMRMASPASGFVIVGGPVSAHGASLDWLSSVTGKSVEELLDAASAVPPGSHGVRFLPYLEGERSPRWRRGLTGEFHGLTTAVGVGELARAVLEGTAYGLGHIAKLLASAGVGIHAVTCTGSPSKSALWCEIKASVLGVPFDTPDFPDLSAYGAALAAGAGVGWWPRPSTAGPGSWPRPAMTRVEPRPDEAFGRGLEEFIELGDFAQARLSEGG